MSRSNEERDTILSVCLEDIQAGRSTMADCLERFPQHRAYLAEMIPLGLELARLPGLDPSPEYRREGKIRLLAAMARRQQALPAPKPDKRPQARPPVFLPGHRIFATVLIVFLLLPVLLCLGGTTVASAAERAVPGDPLYGLDTALESLQWLLTWDTAGRMQLSLGIAAERIAELQELTDRGGSADHIQQAMDGYRQAIERTADVLSHSNQPDERKQLETEIATEISKDLQVLISLRDRLPEKAGTALDQEIKKSLQDEKELEDGSFGPPVKDEGSNKPEKTKTPGKGREKDPGKPD